MKINIQDQLKLITEGENEIKSNITKLTNNFFQKDYILLDKNWFNKFQNNNSNENIFKIQFFPNFDKKTYTFGNKSYTFSIPTSFVLVKKEVIRNLLNYFDKNVQNIFPNLIYDVIIGGECIIIKNKNPNNVHYVSLYDLNSPFQYYNNINFILIYKDIQESTYELLKILQKGFLSYLDEYKIKQDGKSHDLLNSNGEVIGHIIHYTNFQNTSTFNILKENNVFKSNILLKEKKNNYEMNQILHSIMLCLFQTKQFVDELKIEYYKRKTIMVQLFVEYFKNIQKNCSDINFKLYSQLGQNIADTYKDIISEMFSRLDKELSTSKIKDTYKQGQINQFSETSSKKKIIEEIKNGSIVKKLFYTIFEIKATCNCGISNYSYESIIFLYINLDKENKNVLISDKLLNYKKHINIQCHFCGQKIINQNEIKIIIYPRKLIVILEGTNYNNFSLKNQKEIIINNRIYQLYCLCEKNPNNFYFKNSKGWYAYIKNSNFMEYKGIEAIKPAILFYQFNSFINNNDSRNQNINNYNNHKISLSESNNNKFINLNNQMNYNAINNNNMNYMNNNILNNNIINNNNFNNNIINNNMNNNNFICNNMNINMNNNNNFLINGMKNNLNNNNMIINNNFYNNNMNKNCLINNVQMNNMNMNNNMNIKMNNFFNNNVNMNMNNNFFNNNMNFNMNNFNNQRNKIPLLKSKNIFLTFILDGKQLYIESNENETLQNIISKLEKKYNWVKTKSKKAYYYNKQQINIQYTLKQLNISDNSIIYIAS